MRAPAIFIFDAFLWHMMVLSRLRTAGDRRWPTLGKVWNKRATLQVVCELRFFVSTLAALFSSEGPHTSIVEITSTTLRACKPMWGAVWAVQAWDKR